MRRILVLALACAACGPAGVDPVPPAGFGRAEAALVPGSGAGPFVLAKRSETRCRFRRDFWCVNELAQAARVLDAFTPGSLDEEWGFVLPRAVNFSDGRSAVGRADAFALRDLFANDNVDRVSASFSGLLEIPAGAAPNEWSFAVGSDDGFRLRVHDGAATRASEFSGGRGFDYGAAGSAALVVAFPEAGGLFPFELEWFDTTGDGGLELVTRAGRFPTYADPAAWSVVERERFHAPDVRVSLVAEELGGGNVSSGDVVQWTAVVRNEGPAPAYPLQGVDLPGGVREDGVAFSVCLPFGAGFQAFGTLPAGVTTRTTTNGCPTTRLYAFLPGPLAPGQEARIPFQTSVRGFTSQRLCAQGWVAASTTARPDLGRARLQRLTDDPTEANGDDSGNGRVAFGTTASADDDPTCVRFGDPAPAFAITAPAEGATVAAARPTIAGLARTGARVELSLTGPGGAAASCSAVAVAPGAWSCVPGSSLVDGDWTIVARVRDASGSAGPELQRIFVVATPPPERPVLAAPASPTRDPLPSFSGTSAPFLSVEVLDAGGAVVCSAASDAAGRFACGPATPLAEGTWTFRARAVDVNGRFSPLSEPVSVTVDLSGPAAPVLTRPGALTNLRSPAFEGRTEPGATVVVSEGADRLCTATADAAGVFTCTSSRALAEGAHTVALLPSDALGNAGAPGAATFTIDATPPAPPFLDAMPAVVTTRRPAFRGVVEAGVSVVLRPVLASGALGPELCRVDAAAARFECVPGSPMEQGLWVIEGQAVDAAGNVSGSCAPGPLCRPRVTFLLDDGPPEAPRFDAYPPLAPALPTLAGAAESGGTVRVTQVGSGVVCEVPARDGRFVCPTRSVADGGYTFTAVVTDSVGLVSGPGTLQIGVDSVPPPAPELDPIGPWSRTPRQRFAGRAEPGARVEVREAGALVCAATVEASGFFLCTPATDLPQGPHAVAVVALDAAGNTSPATPAAFVLDSIAPDAPLLNALASPLPTRTPTVFGSAEPGTTLRITEGSATPCTTLVPADGRFACLVDPLAEGPHTLRGLAVDAAGNESRPSDPLSFEVSVVAPTRPTLEPVATPTSDSRPTFTGTAQAGDTVEVRDGDHALCSGSASRDGTWSCRVVDDLGDATYSVRAVARDELYRWSEPSDPVLFTVDRTPPPPPVIVTPVRLEKVESFGHATGTAAESARVELFVDDASVGFADVIDGAWTFVATEDRGHALGQHTASAVGIDAAGNRGSESDPVVFEVVGGYDLVGGCGCSGAGMDLGLVALVGLAALRRRRARS